MFTRVQVQAADFFADEDAVKSVSTCLGARLAPRGPEFQRDLKERCERGMQTPQYCMALRSRLRTHGHGAAVDKLCSPCSLSWNSLKTWQSVSSRQRPQNSPNTSRTCPKPCTLSQCTQPFQPSMQRAHSSCAAQSIPPQLPLHHSAPSATLPAPKRLTLKSYRLSSEAAEFSSAVLRALSLPLSELSLIDVTVASEQLQPFCEALARCTALQHLTVSALHLSDLLEQPTTTARCSQPTSQTSWQASRACLAASAASRWSTCHTAQRS